MQTTKGVITPAGRMPLVLAVLAYYCRVESIIVEEYSKQYRDEVIDLILDIQQNEFNIPIRREDQPDLRDIPGFYQKGAGNFWIALCENHVVGTISLLDIGNNQAALRKMFVGAAYRGGYGTAKKLLQKT